LLNLIFDAIPTIYIEELEDSIRVHGYANITPQAILVHLIDTFSTIELKDLNANEAKLSIPWDPSTVIHPFFTNTEGGDALSKETIVRRLTEVFQNSGVFNTSNNVSNEGTRPQPNGPTSTSINTASKPTRTASLSTDHRSKTPSRPTLPKRTPSHPATTPYKWKEGKAQPPRWMANEECELLGDLLTSGGLGDHPHVSHSHADHWMEFEAAGGFRAGISPSRHRMRNAHGGAPRFQHGWRLGATIV
jgi:hypothetical protein